MNYEKNSTLFNNFAILRKPFAITGTHKLLFF